MDCLGETIQSHKNTSLLQKREWSIVFSNGKTITLRGKDTELVKERQKNVK